jgi:lipopolysaccharide/colanic/teichoic acid biosynthesis glycosyltransferase
VYYGYANGLEEETEKMCYDLYYIKHRSLGLDLKVLLLTVKVVLLGQQRIADLRRSAEQGIAGPSQEAA